MFPLNEQDAAAFRSAIDRARGNPVLLAELRGLYDDFGREVAVRQPVCVSSGRCCRFEEFGHRLFVTTIELAGFVNDLSRSADPNWDGTNCPFQEGRLCGVHAIRPFGCRVFYCDPRARQWQEQQYEHFHQKLREMHRRFDVAYHYLEWRSALQAAGLLRT